MPVESEGFDQVQNKLKNIFANMAEDHQLVGEVGATEIVKTTLAGIGENDQPFPPYSPGYKAFLDAVGGKMRQVVDLRGIFYHDGQKRKNYRSEKRRQLEREGRQGFVGIRFAARSDLAAAAGADAQEVSFTGMTKVTRPQVGITDKLSEMSLDLVKVEATDTSLHIVYRPRKERYMIDHQEGNGKLPARKWFTANKTAVMAAMIETLKTCIGARIAWFNNHEATGTPPMAKPDQPGETGAA